MQIVNSLLHQYGFGPPFSDLSELGMAEVGTLIRQLRKALRLSQPALAERIGYPYQRVGEWERGARAPTWEQARALGRFFRRDPNDFYRSREAAAAPGGESSTSADQQGFQYFTAPAGGYAKPWPIPVWDGGQQGFCPHGCVYFDEDFLARHDLNPMHCAVIETRDGSMSPTLPMGSVCLADRRQVKLEDNEIYAFEYEGAPIVRRMQRVNGRWMLHADGKGFIPVRWSEGIVTIGMVIWTASWLGRVRSQPELAVV